LHFLASGKTDSAKSKRKKDKKESRKEKHRNGNKVTEGR
jgi:hypothetical protein